MNRILFSFLAIALALAWPVSATLLISPTKVTFDSDDKVVEVVLMNTSNKVNSYELGWEDKIASELGGYQKHKTQVSHEFSASKMLRFSPRRVTLKPEEKQVVRIMLRRPKDLAEGEYRSHMRFKAIPVAAEQAGSIESAGIKINFTTSFSIPVVVRQGKPEVSLSIEKTSVKVTQPNEVPQVIVSISNNSRYSARGDIVATLEGKDGKPQVIARLNDYSLYPELKKAQVKLAWVGTNNALSDGKLTVSFDGIKEYQGTQFGTKTEQFSVRDVLMK